MTARLDGQRTAPPGAARGPLLRLIAVGLVIAAFILPRTGIAMWAQMSDEELVASSELIVLGEWLGQRQVVLANGSGPQGLGVVAVTEVLKGSRESGFALVARPSATALRSSSDLNFERGQKGLWLLRAAAGGTQGVYLADHPQRFVSASGDAARIASLRRLIDRK